MTQILECDVGFLGPNTLPLMRPKNLNKLQGAAANPEINVARDNAAQPPGMRHPGFCARVAACAGNLLRIFAMAYGSRGLPLLCRTCNEGGLSSQSAKLAILVKVIPRNHTGLQVVHSGSSGVL